MNVAEIFKVRLCNWSELVGQVDCKTQDAMDIEETHNGMSTNSTPQQADPTNIDIPNHLLESFGTLYTLKQQ